MSRNRINIRIFGTNGSGKSTIGLLIANALEKAGFKDVTLIDDEDPIIIEEHQEKRVEALKERLGISISTHNVRIATLKETAVCHVENEPAG